MSWMESILQWVSGCLMVQQGQPEIGLVCFEKEGTWVDGVFRLPLADALGSLKMRCMVDAANNAANDAKTVFRLPLPFPRQPETSYFE